MTKFFKKIGRGFRKLGRGLKKFFKSKIGKVLGTLIMAVALPAMFNAFFTGGVTTGTGAGTATKIGETTVAAGADVAETLGTVAEIKEAKDAVGLGTRLGAALKQTGEIFMSPIEATKRSFDSLWGKAPDMLTSAEQAKEYEKIGDVAINISGEEALSDSKVGDMISSWEKGGSSVGEEFKKVSDQFMENRPEAYFETEASFLEARPAPQSADIADVMGDPLGSTWHKEKDFHNVWSNMSQKQRSRVLRSKEGRGYYEDLFGYSTAESKGIPGLNTLMEAPGTFKGVQPFSSLRDAWQEGKGLEKVGNIMGQVTETPVAKVLPGYEGIGASSSIYSAGKTGIAAYSILGPEETVRAPSSGYSATSAALAKQNLEIGDALASAQPSNSVNLYDYTAQDMGDQNSLQIHQKILRDAGYSYGYGPNAMNTV